MKVVAGEKIKKGALVAIRDGKAYNANPPPKRPVPKAVCSWCGNTVEKYTFMQDLAVSFAHPAPLGTAAHVKPICLPCYDNQTKQAGV